MKEQRIGDRHKTLLKAKIIFNNAMTTIDCVVRNVSASGAHIIVDTAMPLPSAFELEIPMKAKTFLAEIRWRDAKGMGVVFVENAKAPGPDHPQFDRLAQDNARLKAILLGLTLRLEALGQDVPSFF